jgi:uncharacterized repeat protein (TIGR01451 family)
MAIVAFVAARPVTAQTPGLQLEKTLLKNSNVVQVGETLTFAITITNNWNTTVITLPLIDDYDESVMRFLDATPAPDTVIAATGVGSCTGGLPAAGARTLTATYSGTANFNSSTSAGVAHQVNPAQTQTTITGDAPDPSTAGATIAVNYSVTAAGPGGGAPTGNVVVTVDGGQPGETCTGTVADGTCDLPLSVVADPGELDVRDDARPPVRGFGRGRGGADRGEGAEEK